MEGFNLFGEFEPAIFGRHFFVAQLFQPARQGGEFRVVAREQATVRELGFHRCHFGLDRFDPRGQFIRRYLPQLGGLAERTIHAPWLLAMRRDGALDSDKLARFAHAVFAAA